MYSGGHPDAEARAIHRRFAHGLLPRVLPIAAVLHVRGRHSGKTIEVPIVVVPYRWHWYTVSMLGEHSNWVQNVRASGGDALLTHGGRRAVHLVEVDADRGARIIKRYLTFAIGARPHVPVHWRSAVVAFEGVAASYPTFRIERVGKG